MELRRKVALLLEMLTVTLGGAHVSYSRLNSLDTNSQASKAGKLTNVTCKFKEELPVAKVELNST